MSADVLTRLQSQLAALHAKKVDIDSEICEIEGAIRVIEKYLPDGPVGALATSAHYTMTRQQPKQQQILDGLIAILSDGKPRHTHNLLVELTEKGVAVGGSDPRGNLSSYLSREKELFENDRRNGWSLKKQTSDGAATPTEVGDLL